MTLLLAGYEALGPRGLAAAVALVVVAVAFYAWVSLRRNSH
jgi:hypothetical protein